MVKIRTFKQVVKSYVIQFYVIVKGLLRDFSRMIYYQCSGINRRWGDTYVCKYIFENLLGQIKEK